jgi:hypothetical protein
MSRFLDIILFINKLAFALARFPQGLIDPRIPESDLPGLPGIAYGSPAP